MEDKRLQWITGQVSSLRLGSYGGTVHLEVTSGGVRVRTPTPQKQRTIGPDSRATRELALRVADAIISRRNGGRRAAARRRPRSQLKVGGILTPLDIWLAYLRTKFSPLPDNIIEWGRADVAEHYSRLDEEQRSALPSPDTLNNILTALRALDRKGIVPLNAEFDSLEPGVMTQQLQAWVLEGSSVATVSTYWRRFRCAVCEHQRQWPGQWEKRIDKTAAVRSPARRRGKQREVGEDRAETLLRQLQADGEWEAAACLLVARASGRRIGAISGHRRGLHLNGPPLTAEDFTRDTANRLIVTWRAAAAKGGNYGRGDEMQVCPRDLRVVYRWLTRYHPNPLGPSFPLIWDTRNPAFAAPYDAITAAFAKAWRRAFGTDKPKGLAWHAVIRTTVTTIAETEGVVAAAVHTGREVETVQRNYVVRRAKHQEDAVAVLDSRRRKFPRPGTP